jgi:endonuclease/exonuclease/phosphatase family metal-dependent hydrolase
LEVPRFKGRLPLGIVILLLCILWIQGEPVRSEQHTIPPILITEVYFDTVGVDGDEEWIEIANLSANAIDLSNYRLGDEESQGGGEGMVRFPSDALIEPATVIVIAQTATGFRRLFGQDPQYELRESDTSVPNLATDTEWAAGEVALANDGDEVLLFDQNGLVVDAVAYGDSAYASPGTYSGPAVVPGPTGQSIERIPAGCDTDTSADWRIGHTPLPGQITLGGTCAEAEPLPIQELITIGEIQGSGSESPLLEMEVSFRGIVTGRLEDQNTRGVRFHTFFVQDLPGEEDGDSSTSDGIAIFVGARPPAVVPGDIVIVSGRVTEFFGLTEIDNNGLQVRVESQGNRLPSPIPLSPPAGNEAASRYFEPLEGMRVSLPVATVAGPTFGGCGFAAVSGPALESRVFRHSLEDPVGNLINVLNTTDVVCDGFPAVTVGDRINGLVGPLTYHFELFKMVLQDPASLEILPADRLDVQAPPVLEDAQFSVATLNLENYFDGIQDTDSDAEPLFTADQLSVKRAKLTYSVAQTLGCPTILAVQEVEKRELLLEIASELNSECGFEYQVNHLESPDARGLDLALLTDPRRSTALGTQLRQACSKLDTGVVDPGFHCPLGERPLFSRPPLEVELLVYGRPLTIYVNHFKSKREGEVETAPLRLAQARFMAKLVEEIVVQDLQAGIIVLGDFNDYDHSEVMRLLTVENRLHHILAGLPPGEQYSYNFAGAAQLIDWILISSPLVEKVLSASIAHVNADFPFTLAEDVNAGLPYRSSDHDSPLVVLEWVAEDVPEPTAPVPTAAAPTATVPMPSPSATAPVEASGEIQGDSLDFWALGLLVLGGGAILAAILLMVRRGARSSS